MTRTTAFLILPILAATLIGASFPRLHEDDQNYVRLVRAEETVSARSYYNDSGSLAYRDNRHCLKLIFKLMGSDGLTTAGTSGETGSSGTSSASTGDLSMGIGEVEPTTSTTGSCTGSTSGSGGGGDVTVTYGIAVESPGEMGLVAGSAPTAVSSLPGYVGTFQGLEGGFGSAGSSVEVPVQISSDGALAATSVTVVFIQQSVTPDDPDTPANEYAVHYSCQKVTYDIAKYICNVASIDSRKTYGQPNTAGVIPADPNTAPDRNVNFANWIWKGGLFAGTMDWPSTNDFSGYSRIQVYPGSSVTTPRLATLSLLHLGAHPAATSALTLGVYVPRSDDPNLSVSDSTLTWANKWDIVPRSAPDGSRDDSKDPLSTDTFDTSSTAPEFANWQLTTVGFDSATTNPRAVYCPR